MVVDAQDLQRAQVDQRVQPLDGVGIVVVQRKSAHPDEAVEDPSPLLLFEAEFSHRPRVDAHVVDFGQQASAAQCLLEARIGFHGLLDQQDLFDRDHGPRIGPEVLCDHLAAFKIDAALPDAHHAAPVDVEPGDAGERRPCTWLRTNSFSGSSMSIVSTRKSSPQGKCARMIAVARAISRAESGSSGWATSLTSFRQ